MLILLRPANLVVLPLSKPSLAGKLPKADGGGFCVGLVPVQKFTASV